MTNNPKKITDLGEFGIEVVERVALEVEPNPHNINYLRTKKLKLGHLLTKV
jgi:3,4-dihydroxy 2-butanone 4-phosphate synthase/GTP cyclohydrolase II